tara:strand:+ start:313 stop:1059 length:747 start_codon:yes stop_codon:yes gene_type:complete
MSKSVFVETLNHLTWKDFLYISAIDIGFYVFIYFALYIWTLLLQIKAAPLAALDINSVALQKQSELAQTLGAMKGFLTFLIILIIVFAIIAILSLTFFKGLIYARALKKKFSKKAFIDFLKTNTIWYLGFATILILLMLWARTKIYGPALLLLIVIFMVYTTVVYQTVRINKTPKVFSTTFKIAFKKIHKFIVPILIMLGIFIIISFVSKMFLYMPPIPSTILTAALFIFYITWARYYMINIIKKFIH